MRRGQRVLPQAAPRDRDGCGGGRRPPRSGFSPRCSSAAAAAVARSTALAGLDGGDAAPGLLAKSCGGRPHNRGGRARRQPSPSGTAACNLLPLSMGFSAVFLYLDVVVATILL